jgi:glycosyltransferase involved in cell wall biosynthesis
MSLAEELEIAVIVPCFNEARTIAEVVRDFRAHLPTATVYVYDNNSTDDTLAVATAAGAVVRRTTRRGKGNVVRQMFQDTEADVYVMVDGDDTYDASVAPQLVEKLVSENLDMVVGRRMGTHPTAYRTGHRFGNRVLTHLVGLLFGSSVDDMLSGYRVFSRRFVKSFPSSSREFEIETEFTVHALQMRMEIAEVETDYKERPPGSVSKLRTFRDGWYILLTIINLVRNERPLLFFTLVGFAFFVVGAVIALPVFLEYLHTGLVPRFPTAILSFSLGVIAVICIVTGLVLDLIAHVRREAKRLAYLNYPAPNAKSNADRTKTKSRAPKITIETR